jgi:hypothetical protein
MTFDMDNFLERCELALKASGRSPVTLSKKLFGNPSALPRLLDKSGSARLDTLIEAERRLSELEGEATSHAA